jgi:SIR2-like domain
MDQNELTAIFCERPQNFTWFLGAGASRSSGLPTAIDIIWDLKRRHYCKEENEDISRQEVQIEAVKRRIQDYMLSKGFPEEWAAEEYTTYFEKIFGTDKERQRRYLTAILSEDKATLSVGNRVLGAYLSCGLARAVFTTNFDSILENAVAEVSGTSLSAYHIEGSRSATQALNNEEFPIYCKLHGDFRYDSVKNLAADLLMQDGELAGCMKVACNRFGFIVAGYSGRDASVMSLFRDAIDGQNPFPHGLYWTGIKGSSMPKVVEELLKVARSKGVKAEYVEIETFDALMLRLWRNTPNKNPELDRKVRKSQASKVSIPLIGAGGAKPLLRFNALPLIAVPTECYSLAFNSQKHWLDLKNAQRESKGNLILTKGEEFYCWGAEVNIKASFKDVKTLEHFNFKAQLEKLDDHLYLQGFLEEALSKALVSGKPLLTRTIGSKSYVIMDAYAEDKSVFTDLISAAGGSVHGKIAGLFAPKDEFHSETEQVFWAEALRISLDVKDGKFWLLVDPDIWIWPHRARRLAVDFMDRRRCDRYNNKYNTLLDAWVHLILGTSAKNITVTLSAFWSGSGPANPSFSIGSRTAFSQRAQ